MSVKYRTMPMAATRRLLHSGTSNAAIAITGMYSAENAVGPTPAPAGPVRWTKTVTRSRSLMNCRYRKVRLSGPWLTELYPMDIAVTTVDTAKASDARSVDR